MPLGSGEGVSVGALPAPREGSWAESLEACLLVPRGPSPSPGKPHTPLSSQPLPSSISRAPSWSLGPPQLSHSVGASPMLVHLPRWLPTTARQQLVAPPSPGRVIRLLPHLQGTVSSPPTVENPSVPPSSQPQQLETPDPTPKVKPDANVCLWAGSPQGQPLGAG